MKTIFKSGLLIAFLFSVDGLTAQIALGSEPPVAGRANTIILREPASEIVITYRPNSAVVRRDTLRADPPATAFTWTPGRAGVVKIRSNTGERNVSVRFNDFPWGGLLVMVVAASVLFGGAGIAFRILFQTRKQPLEMENYPDT